MSIDLVAQPGEPVLSRAVCRNARLARDARFDGLFFTGVKTTGIFCRPTCPAPPPKEHNVDYYQSALLAARAGLRPCLRCRPEAAPGSPAWMGVQTTFSRAVRMIDKGEWRDQSLPQFAGRLGVSDRYLRKLFQQQFGVSPLKYANFRRALFAKQLLQQTDLLISETAYIAGFGSVRRFNAVFVELMGLNPRDVRREQTQWRSKNPALKIFLSYRPPYNWTVLRDFYRMRQITGLETVTDCSYSRSIAYKSCQGVFKATHIADRNGFEVELYLSRPEYLMGIIQRIRRLLDLDADSSVISQHFNQHPTFEALNSSGIRLPGIWSGFEAGTRAILGQQVSLKAANKLVARLVEELGQVLKLDHRDANITPKIIFPSPQAIAGSNLEFLTMPNRRRQALRLLANFVLEATDDMPTKDWLNIPGIGPWTLQYATFRMGHPDIFLDGDLGVKNALKWLEVSKRCHINVGSEKLSPWGSYATLLLWQNLSKLGNSQSNPVMKQQTGAA